MDEGLLTLVSELQPVTRESAVWGDSELTVDCYISNRRPPNRLITSVRGIVLRDESVLVVIEAADHYHVVPGGRRENKESLESTLNREIGEETGWTIKAPVYLGFAHFHHLTPRPAGYGFPYPDFCHLYFTVQAHQFRPERKLPEELLQNENVLGTKWLPIDAALQLSLDEGQLALLKTVKMRKFPGPRSK